MISERHILEDEILSKVGGSLDIRDRLYRYLEEKNIPRTKNSNGLYVNVSTLSLETLHDILAHVREAPERYTPHIIHEKPNTFISRVEKPAVHYRAWKLSAFQRRLLQSMTEIS